MFRTSLVLGLCLTLSLAAGADDAWVALVTSAKGPCTVNGQPLHTLTRLKADDRLKTGAGGEVTVAFLSGGQRYHVGSDTVITVSSGGLPSQPNVVALSTTEYNAALMPAGANLDRLGGMSQAHVHPRVRAVVMAQVEPPVLGFTDEVRVPLDGKSHGYDVTITDQVGHQAHMHVNGSPGTVTLDKLVAGQTYRVDVSNLFGQGQTYRVVRWPAEQQLHMQEAPKAALDAYRSNPTDPTPFAFMCSMYEAYGCYAQAETALDGVRAEVSDQGPYLDQLKASLEQDVAQVEKRAREAHQ